MWRCNPRIHLRLQNLELLSYRGVLGHVDRTVYTALLFLSLRGVASRAPSLRFLGINTLVGSNKQWTLAAFSPITFGVCPMGNQESPPFAIRILRIMQNLSTIRAV